MVNTKPITRTENAGCPNTLTVAATDINAERSPYSNFGASVEIAAPGGVTKDQYGIIVDKNGDGYPDGVLSSVPGGYDFYPGTSMAAPHVAGVAALLFAQGVHTTPAAVALRIMETAAPISCDQPCGVGLLDANAALK